MAYQVKNLSGLAYTNGFTLWHYVTEDNIDTVLYTEGYWEEAKSMLRKGDVIKVIADRDAELCDYIELVVRRNDGVLEVTG